MRQREAQRRAKLKRQKIGNEVGWLLVQRRRRAVRITAVNQPSAMVGAPCAASFAFCDLTDAQVDRLIQRLTAIRGGKRALP